MKKTNLIKFDLVSKSKSVSNSESVSKSKLISFGAASLVAIFALTGCAANEQGSAQPERNTGSSGSDTTNSGASNSDASSTDLALSELTGSLSGVGASSQGEAQNAWIASFLDVAPGINVSYDPAGSGAGRENFQQGASDFAGSDRPFNDEELANGEFLMCAADSGLKQLPLYASPIAVVFNVPGVDSINLDASTVAKIFTGEVDNWNSAEIADQNPGVQLPDLKISPVHRSDKSGTTGNFTAYLAEEVPEDWNFGSVEEWPFAEGEAAPGTSGVVSAVSIGEGTIGYIDGSRVDNLTTVKILSDAEGVTGEYVQYDAEFGLYPIVLQSYLIACETYVDESKAENVKAYLSFVASEDGQRVAAENAGSTPIGAELTQEVEEAIAQIK